VRACPCLDHLESKVLTGSSMLSVSSFDRTGSLISSHHRSHSCSGKQHRFRYDCFCWTKTALREIAGSAPEPLSADIPSESKRLRPITTDELASVLTLGNVDKCTVRGIILPGTSYSHLVFGVNDARPYSSDYSMSTLNVRNISDAPVKFACDTHTQKPYTVKE
jgi:hypothetical protein